MQKQDYFDKIDYLVQKVFNYEQNGEFYLEFLKHKYYFLDLVFFSFNFHRNKIIAVVEIGKWGENPPDCKLLHRFDRMNIMNLKEKNLQRVIDRIEEYVLMNF